MSDKSVFVLQKCSRIILTIEHKLMFHVLVHYKYSVVNIIACFAGPTTWGQKEQRPGDRVETWGQSRDLGIEVSDWRGERTFGVPRCLGRPPQKRAYLSWMRMMPDRDLILFRVLLSGSTSTGSSTSAWAAS